MASYKNTPTYLEIIRRPAVLTITGKSKSSLRLDIINGLMPPPISLGDRAVGFFQHEILAVIAALGAGYSKSEIQTLVKQLISERQTYVRGCEHE